MEHIKVAVSETAFIEFFNHIRDNLQIMESDSADLGPFVAGYEIDIRLKNGSVDLRDDNTVRIAELDIDPVIFRGFIGIDIPELCIGGFCIIPTPFGCLLRAPRLCIFDDSPDIGLDLDLAPFLRSEVSFIGGLRTVYFTDPDRPLGMDYIDAQSAGFQNKWQIFLDPESVDIDLFDFADIAGDLLEEALDTAIDTLLGFLPGWAKDLIRAIFGPLIDMVRAILDLPDDIGEWLSDVFGESLGLLNLIADSVITEFANKNSLFEFEDPFQILPASGGLIPVKVPISDLSVRVTDDEMIAKATIEA